ncbi:ABC transporter permease [Phytohabitans kaempferiae]|uniref:ABC transporter permease n=1 Tax=Phytohabitans kaempferiae TaxID=1620943 RepID=A0ABV6MA07_9ACTN
MKTRSFSIYLLVAASFLLAPLAVVVMTAFNAGDFAVFPPEGWSLRWITAVPSNRAFMDALLLSVQIALVTTVLTLAVALPAGYALARRRFRGRRLVEIGGLGPLAVPEIVVGLSIFVFYAGFLRLESGVGMLILGHAVVGIPIALQVLIATFASLGNDLEEAAVTLGASPLKVFRRVTLPLVWPGAVGAALLVFIFSFDNISISLFLTSPGRVTLPVQMYQYLDYRADPSVAAMSGCLVAVGLVIFLLANKLGALRHMAGGKA